MSEERGLFSCRKPLVRSGANKIQVRVLMFADHNSSLIRSGRKRAHSAI